MRFLISIILFFSLLDISSSQSNKHIYGELLGNGALIASINYDQRLSNSEDGFGFRVGVSIVDLSPVELTFPIMLNYLIGSKHQLELGAGILILTDNISFNSGDDLSGIAFTAALMYRLNFDNGLVFRFGYTPIIDNTSYPLWLGTSIGFRF